MDDEKEKRQGSSGSGKSPTKFMERPGSKPEKKEKKDQNQGSDFINDDLDALENQEGDMDYEGWKPPPKPKGDQKPDQRKSQEPEKRDSSSGDTGDCACP